MADEITVIKILRDGKKAIAVGSDQVEIDVANENGSVEQNALLTVVVGLHVIQVHIAITDDVAGELDSGANVVVGPHIAWSRWLKQRRMRAAREYRSRQ